MENKHTKGEWYFEKHPDTSDYIGNITSDLGQNHIRTIACLLDYAGKDESIANGQFICKCVNAHDDIVKALQDVSKQIDLHIKYKHLGIGYLEEAKETIDKALSKSN